MNANFHTFSEWHPKAWNEALKERHAMAEIRNVRNTAESTQVETGAKGLMWFP